MSGQVVCYCGSPAHLDTNAKLYNGREYGNGKVWLCDRWPTCDGSVGTHPDGSPLGSLIDTPTRKYRRAVHATIDPLWQSQERSKKRARGSVYGWLCKIMDLPPKDCHVGHWDAETCKRALEQMELHPYELKYERQSSK